MIPTYCLGPNPEKPKDFEKLVTLPLKCPNAIYFPFTPILENYYLALYKKRSYQSL